MKRFLYMICFFSLLGLSVGIASAQSSDLQTVVEAQVRATNSNISADMPILLVDKNEQLGWAFGSWQVQNEELLRGYFMAESQNDKWVASIEGMSEFEEMLNRVPIEVLPPNFKLDWTNSHPNQAEMLVSALATINRQVIVNTALSSYNSPGLGSGWCTGLVGLSWGAGGVPGATGAWVGNHQIVQMALANPDLIELTPDISKAQPGDAILYTYLANPLSQGLYGFGHSGIYIGNGEAVHWNSEMRLPINQMELNGYTAAQTYEWVAHLKDVSVAPTGRQLIQNGDFSSGMTAWNLWGGIQTSITSTGELALHNNNSDGSIYQTTNFSLPAGAPIEASIWIQNLSNTPKRLALTIRNEPTWDGSLTCYYDIPANSPKRAFALRGIVGSAWSKMMVEFRDMQVQSVIGLSADDLFIAYNPDTVQNSGPINPSPQCYQLSDPINPNNLLVNSSFEQGNRWGWQLLPNNVCQWSIPSTGGYQGNNFFAISPSADMTSCVSVLQDVGNPVPQVGDYTLVMYGRAGANVPTTGRLQLYALNNGAVLFSGHQDFSLTPNSWQCIQAHMTVSQSGANSIRSEVYMWNNNTQYQLDQFILLRGRQNVCPQIPTPTPTSTSTPLPTNTPVPTSTSIPTSTPAPTNTPVPTNTLVPTNTPVVPTNTPVPTTEPLSPACRADVNGDSIVSTADLDSVIPLYNVRLGDANYRPEFDIVLPTEGLIDIYDLVLITNHIGLTCP